MENRRGLYYCDYKGCKGTCLIPMSGEDCYTLGLVHDSKDYLNIRKYRWWVKWVKQKE